MIFNLFISLYSIIKISLFQVVVKLIEKYLHNFYLAVYFQTLNMRNLHLALRELDYLIQYDVHTQPPRRALLFNSYFIAMI